MLVDAVIARLKALSIIDRVGDAMALKQLVSSGALPTAEASAFVVPMTLRGGQVVSANAPFVQSVEETLAVILAVRDATAAASRAKDRLTALRDAVVLGIAGWQPPGGIDVFRLQRGALVDFSKGVVLYQIEFATQSQLRILP